MEARMPTLTQDAAAASSDEADNLSKALMGWNAGLDPDRTEALEPGNNGLIGLVAGDFAGEVERVWSGPRIGEYLSASDTRRQIWHAWLASDRAELGRKFRSDAQGIYRRLTTAKARELIEASYGACPRGMIRALGKCGPTARSADFYRALFSALARDDLGAKFLRHATSLSDALVLNVAALPTRLQSKPFFEAVRGYAIPERDMAYFAWRVARLEALGLAGAADAIYLAAKPKDALRAAIKSLPFPPPPWAGGGKIRAIASQEDLERVGGFLGNCMKSAMRAAAEASEVRKGGAVFYEWTGEEPGLLRFSHVPPFGWKLDEARSVRNQPLSCSTWAAIERTLATWTSLAPICSANDGAPPDEDF
jgi:hypothetical protein